MVLCYKCDGTGKVPSIEVAKNRELVPCKNCDGTGHIYGEAVTNDHLRMKVKWGVIYRCKTCYAVFTERRGEKVKLGVGISKPSHTHEFGQL